MFSPTLPRARLASTKHGMRRILKKKGPVSEYIRQATESGVYRTNEELDAVWRERRESADDLRVVMQRFRQDIVRGTSVVDYPIEYQILQQHPPIPDPLRTPKRLLKKMPKEPNPVEKLTRKYLQRQSEIDKSHEESHEREQMSSEDYYRRVLGVPFASSQQGVPLKSAAVQKAYNSAIHHYRLQRTQGMDEAEAMVQVDLILEQQAHEEQARVRERAAAVKEAKATPSAPDSETKTGSTGNTEASSESEAELREEGHTDLNEDTTLETILGNPRTVEAMMRWSERLAAVPYSEWTVGASTTLDHWVARKVLLISEETWLSLLEGTDPSLLEQGREIVAIRETLFPETQLDLDIEGRDQDASAEPQEKQTASGDKTVEELLESLGALETVTTTTKATAASASTGDDLDKQVAGLMDQLQEYRRQHASEPYVEWTKADQDSFNRWIQQDYLPLLVQGGQKVDVAATREALLSVPPTIADHVFWSRLLQAVEGDDAVIDLLLQDETYSHLLPSDLTKLPVEEQMERIRNLQALRPLLEDYASEASRHAFVQRHAHDLLSNIRLEHLVEDPEGPISVSDLPAELARGQNANARFRLDVQDNEERTKAMLLMWNQQKAGRAHYEERLFRTGRLGLRYNSKDEKDS